MTTSGSPDRLEPLPGGYAATREAVHRLACYVLSPARKAVTGRIGLQSTPGGFGTPVFGAPVFGTAEQLRIDGPSLVRQRDGKTETEAISSLAAAADFAGVTLSDDPGVGSDLPGMGDPDVTLAVTPAAVAAIGVWFEFSASVLDELRAELEAAGQTCSPAQLWPEHFDLGCNMEGVNFGCSPGDGYFPEPYVYVGPWKTDGLPDGDFWNAPFGAALPYKDVVGAEDQRGAALTFLRRGARLALRRAASNLPA